VHVRVRVRTQLVECLSSLKQASMCAGVFWCVRVGVGGGGLLFVRVCMYADIPCG